MDGIEVIIYKTNEFNKILSKSVPNELHSSSSILLLEWFEKWTTNELVEGKI